MFRKKKKELREEYNKAKMKTKPFCEKCGTKENLANRSPRGGTYCDKCWEICLTWAMPFLGSNRKDWAEESYVWYDSIDEKGIEWYKMARDKIIKREEKRNKILERKEELKKKKIIDRIEKW